MEVDNQIDGKTPDSPIVAEVTTPTIEVQNPSSEPTQVIVPPDGAVATPPSNDDFFGNWNEDNKPKEVEQPLVKWQSERLSKRLGKKEFSDTDIDDYISQLESKTSDLERSANERQLSTSFAKKIDDLVRDGVHDEKSIVKILSFDANSLSHKEAYLKSIELDNIEYLAEEEGLTGDALTVALEIRKEEALEEYESMTSTQKLREGKKAKQDLTNYYGKEKEELIAELKKNQPVQKQTISPNEVKEKFSSMFEDVFNSKFAKENETYEINGVKIGKNDLQKIKSKCQEYVVAKYNPATGGYDDDPRGFAEIVLKAELYQRGIDIAKAQGATSIIDNLTLPNVNSTPNNINVAKANQDPVLQKAFAFKAQREAERNR